MNDIEKQRIVVFGGSSGIGYAAAARLLALGADVTIAGRSAERLGEASRTLGEVGSASVDCADAEAVIAFFRDFGSVAHVVVSLAGSAALGPFASLDGAALRNTFEGKFWPYINVMRAALPMLERDGSLTMVTGTSAISAAPGAASLSAVNGALEGMLKTLSVELAPRRINAVSPGLTDTAAWSRVPDDIRNDMYEKAAAETPAGRVGQADDVAQGVVACVVTPFLTGALIPIDGGKRFT